MMLTMYNNNTRRLCLTCIIISLVAATISISCFLGLPKPSFKEVSTAKIQNYGIIASADTPPPTPSSGVEAIGWLSEASRIVTALSGLLALAGAIAGLAKWLKWRAKYGKCRTPIYSKCWGKFYRSEIKLEDIV